MTKRTLGRLAVMAVILLGFTGCASIEVSPSIKSCHDYRVNSGYGRFAIQQSAKGKALQWGAYPNATYSGTWYATNVRVDGRKIDSKSQSYAPHGSVSANTAAKYSGKILSISGNVTKGKSTVLVYNMQCRIM